MLNPLRVGWHMFPNRLNITQLKKLLTTILSRAKYGHYLFFVDIPKVYLDPLKRPYTKSKS